MSAKLSSGQKARSRVQSFDDLFSTSGESTFGQFDQKIGISEKEIKIEELHPFVNHPFPVNDDEELDRLAESIKEHGLLHAILVRPRAAGGYEIISGHRRSIAAKKAGLKIISCKIVELSDDEATACMVEANFHQREFIQPSVKALAYRMEYDAIKHQGKNTGMWSLDNMGEAAGESSKTVQRFIRLSYLSASLLGMVDAKKLPILQGVTLSYLDEEAQRMVYEVLLELGIVISEEQAKQIKVNFEMGNLNKDFLYEILTVKKKSVRKFVLKNDVIDSYFGLDYSDKEIEEIILNLLNEWKESR